MLLVIDIGNTNIVLGLFRMGGGRPAKSLTASWRMATDRRNTCDQYGSMISGFLARAGFLPSHIQSVAVASVVPSLDKTFREMSDKYFRTSAFFIRHGVRTGVRVFYDNPADLGADRLVNAAAAFDRVKRSCIVVDFGTATKFDCVGPKGEFLGGVIAPGPLMGAEALAQKTAKLPLAGPLSKPRSAIGRNTLDCLAAGLFYGFVGLTEGLLNRLKKEMRGNPPVLATGGLAGVFAPAVKGVKHVIPDLTLQGIRLLWERNH